MKTTSTATNLTQLISEPARNASEIRYLRCRCAKDILDLGIRCCGQCKGKEDRKDGCNAQPQTHVADQVQHGNAHRQKTTGDQGAQGFDHSKNAVGIIFNSVNQVSSCRFFLQLVVSLEYRYAHISGSYLRGCVCR